MSKEYYAMIRRSTNELSHYGRLGMKKGQHIFGEDEDDLPSRNVSGNFTEKKDKLKQIIAEKTAGSSGTVYDHPRNRKSVMRDSYERTKQIMKENEERRKRRQTKEGQENRRVNDRELRRNAIITDTNRKHRRNTNIYQRLNGR